MYVYRWGNNSKRRGGTMRDTAILTRAHLLQRFPHAASGFLDANSADSEPATIAARSQERAARRSRKEKCREAELQAQVEQWLHLRGYWRRTPADITGQQPPAGWQIHLHETRRNPILLDVLLLSNAGHYLEFELKVGTPPHWSSPHQRMLVEESGAGWLCQSLDEVIDLVKWWEGARKTGQRGMSHD